MKQKNYYLGLNLGTSSIGWAVMDENYHLMRKKGKTTMGTYLFREGESAEGRRMQRGGRRRTSRRKWRLSFVDQLFKSEIDKVDPDFFARLKDSNVSPMDQSKKYLNQPLLMKNEKNVYRQYPTIYHLREALMNENRKFDIRLVYLAIHHIQKYRGNFLDSTPYENYNAENTDIVGELSHINDYFVGKYNLKSNVIDLDQLNNVKDILLDFQNSNSVKAKKLLTALDTSDDKIISAKLKIIFSGMVGNLLNLQKLFDDESLPKFKLSEEDSNETIEQLSSSLNSDDYNLILGVQKIYSWMTLNSLIPQGKISQSMVQKYDLHQEQLKIYKAIEKEVSDEDKHKLKDYYSSYINNETLSNSLDIDTFKSKVKKVLNNYSSDNVKQLLTLIEQDTADNPVFMPKQRVSNNGVIPHQLHQKEMNQIIENQGKYYPWLLDIQSKLNTLLEFKIPYYVGPMVDDKGSKFAWMVRKEPGTITPYNFSQKIDLEKTAEKFIRRMTAKDNCLLSEDVLPNDSLLYQYYKVISELNNARIDDRHFTMGERQVLLNELFKKHVTVTTKAALNALNRPKSKITGLSNENRFNNNLSTYIKFKNIFGTEIVDDDTYFNDLEKITKWATLFEDNSIFMQKLNELSWLTPEMKSKLKGFRLNGWGRYSRKLLLETIGTVDDKSSFTRSIQTSILEAMWTKGLNIQQVLSQDSFKLKIEKHNKNVLQKKSLNDVLNESYLSPANKKAVRKVVKLVDDIEKAMGYAPCQISIEFTREKQNSNQPLKAKYELEKTYRKLDDNFAKSLKAQLKGQENDELLKHNSQIRLYFLQMGRDIYTGKRLNIDFLSQNCEVDHIIPQSATVDNSIDNKVLTSKNMNSYKSNREIQGNFAYRAMPDNFMGCQTIGDFWKMLLEKGLMSKKKYDLLLRKSGQKVSPYAIEGYTKRQLVETSQIVKFVADYLNTKYKEQAKILTIRASNVTKLRDRFKFYKVHFNDYHHAFDAYLIAVIGLYLYKRYPKLRKYFTYGEFAKFDAEYMAKLGYIDFLHDIPVIQDDGFIEYKKVVNKNGEIVFDTKDVYEQLNRAYHFKKVNVVKETWIDNGQLYNQTILQSPRYNSANKALIPIKNNKDSQIYGGYTSKKVAYMAIIKFDGQDTFKIVNVPTIYVNKLNRLRKNDFQAYMNFLKKVISKELTSSMRKKKFKIVIDYMPKNQVVIDGQKLTIMSAKENHKFMEPVLSDSVVKTVYDIEHNNDVTEEEMMKAYQEISDFIKQYFNKFKSNTLKKKGFSLDEKKQEYAALSTDDKKQSLRLIANALVIDSTTITKPKLGRWLRLNSAIALSSQAQLVTQSISGLFEKRVKLSSK